MRTGGYQALPRLGDGILSAESRHCAASPLCCRSRPFRPEQDEPAAPPAAAAAQAPCASRRRRWRSPWRSPWRSWGCAAGARLHRHPDFSRRRHRPGVQLLGTQGRGHPPQNPGCRHRRGGRKVRRRPRPVAQATGQTARPPRHPAGGKPAGDRPVDRRLYPHDRPLAPGPRHPPAHRRNAAQRRIRRGGGGRGDRRRHPGPGGARHVRRGPRRPDPARRRGARDRPPPSAQPHPRAVPQLRRPARRCGADQRVAAPGRCGAARPGSPRRRRRGGRAAPTATPG